MLLAVFHGVMYVLSFAAVLTLFATLIALAVWLLMMAWRRLGRDD
jgi:hypothetical protein